MRSIPRPRVLIVEGEPEIAQFFTCAFRHLGFLVQWSPDGLHGIMRLLQERPHVIVLDMENSGLDAGRFCRRLARDRRTAPIPIVLLNDSAGPDASIPRRTTGISDGRRMGGIEVV